MIKKQRLQGKRLWEGFLPIELDENMINYGKFTKNGRFIISIFNMTKYQPDFRYHSTYEHYKETTELDIKIWYDYFIKRFDGKRFRSKKSIEHDRFIFSKKWSDKIKAGSAI
tara:strand:- start:134 stop:469 length:336 start_codon:yes stop_codon:yes gene_type:complete